MAIATTCKEPWVVAVKAIHGNPYDGHTLKETVEKAEEITEVKAETVFADRGYKGNKSVLTFR